jgi:hypothetical protein
MTKLEQNLENFAKSKEKELKRKALIPGSNQRYVSVSFEHEKVEHQIIYDRQLSKFIKIVYLMRVKGINTAKEILLDW